MKEAADLTYDEARRKLLKTYGTPERIHIKSMKDVEEAFHAQMCEVLKSSAERAMLRTAERPVRIAGSRRSVLLEAKPAVTWRNFPDHKSETRAVKEALKKAGIEAEVKHGRGTAWGWLEINIGDPRLRDGLRQGPFGSKIY